VKALIEQSIFAERLQIVQKAVSNRTTLPILSGIYVEAISDNLTLYATDLEIAIKTSAKAQIKKEGQIVLPAKLITEIVKNLPEAKVELVSNENENTLQIKSQQSTFNLNTLAPDDYPHFPDTEDTASFKILKKDFDKAVRQVINSASKDESRPILTGALINIEKEKIKIVATDSYRLALKEISSKNSSATQAIIPHRALDEASKIECKDIKITLSPNQAVFYLNDTTIVSRLINGQYPNYSQLFPQKFETTIVSNKDELLSAVKRVSILSLNNTPLKINTSSGKLKISAETADYGSANEEIMATTKGKDIEIAFNAKYLIDGLLGIDGENAVLELVDPLQPGILKSDEKGFNYLLMPIRLS